MVGLTIVAFGTSMPEMVVSGKAALSGNRGWYFLTSMLVYTVGMIMLPKREAVKTAVPEPQASVPGVKRSPLPVSL